MESLKSPPAPVVGRADGSGNRYEGCFPKCEKLVLEYPRFSATVGKRIIYFRMFLTKLRMFLLKRRMRLLKLENHFVFSLEILLEELDSLFYHPVFREKIENRPEKIEHGDPPSV